MYSEARGVSSGGGVELLLGRADFEHVRGQFDDEFQAVFPHPFVSMDKADDACAASDLLAARRLELDGHFARGEGKCGEDPDPRAGKIVADGRTDPFIVSDVSRGDTNGGGIGHAGVASQIDGYCRGNLVHGVELPFG